MIIKNDAEKIRLKCEPVLPEEVGELVEKLEKELEYSARLGSPGIGLAAPQIGIAKNIAIIRIDAANSINLINCNLVEGFDLGTFPEEGCLSFPDLIIPTQRYQQIYCNNNLTYPHSFVATGLVAVCIQHELDHLNQILLLDKVKNIQLNKNLQQSRNELCLCSSGKKFKKCCGKG